MCIALQKRSVKTKINCKEKDQQRTSKVQNSLSAESIFSNIACVHIIVFIMFKQNLVVTMNIRYNSKAT